MSDTDILLGELRQLPCGNCYLYNDKEGCPCACHAFPNEIVCKGRSIVFLQADLAAAQQRIAALEAERDDARQNARNRVLELARIRKAIRKALHHLAQDEGWDDGIFALHDALRRGTSEELKAIEQAVAERDAARQEAARLREALEMGAAWLDSRPDYTEGDIATAIQMRDALAPATVCAECGSAKLLPAAGIGLVCSDCGADKTAMDAECQHEWVVPAYTPFPHNGREFCRHCGKRAPEVQ